MGLRSAAQFGRNSAVAADGSFEIPVSAGEYRLSVWNLPANAYVKAARAGRTDALLGPIDIRLDNRDTVEILVSLAAGEIAGTVFDRTSAPVSGTPVILIPEDRSRRDLYRSATTDPMGQFRIQGIPPGNYDLYAWEDLERFAYFDPEVVRAYDSLRQPIHVGESSRLTTTLKVIPNLRQ